MPKIQVPKPTAIKSLNGNLYSLDKVFDAPLFEAWQSNAANDVKAIFGPLGDISDLDLRHIRIYSALPGSTLNDAKIKAKELLTGYIAYIEKFLPDPVPTTPIQQELLENKMNLTLQVDENMRIHRKLQAVGAENTAAKSEISLLKANIKISQQKIADLEKNTVQLNDLTLAKIWVLIKHLPIAHTWALIGAIAAVLGVAYWIGTITVTH
jgi:hypothetical protein